MASVRVLTTFVLIGLPLVLPTAAGAAGFGFGVAAGDVTSTSAILWTRADVSGRVILRVSHSGRVVQRHNADAQPVSDNAVRVRVRHLRPGTRYSYAFFMGPSASATGHFETAPPRRGRQR